MLGTAAESFLTTRWDDLVPILSDYIAIPARSPAFDPGWAQTGHIERAAALLADWARARDIEGCTVEVVRLEGRTPVILCDVPAHACDRPETVLCYGHLDKQPELTGWRDGLSAWEPVLEGGRLYGRGGADDGYSIFAALSAIEAVRLAGGSHARCVVLIEASEESGSPDLPAYITALADRLGDVDLVVTLDSGGESWDRLWITTSLRGLVSFDLRVDHLTAGVHSGWASGVLPSTFRILRILLDRIEDARSGRVLVDECHVEVPAHRLEELRRASSIAARTRWPVVEGARPTHDDPLAAMRAGTWEPTISYVGVDGMPALADAGNVLRPHTALKLSFRLPPTADAQAAYDALAQRCTQDPPYGAKVTISGVEVADGWDAPAPQPWLTEASDRASQRWFSNPAASIAIGGSIPFMAMLGREFPDAQFLIVGVVGPGCNIHGPNEFLDLDFARRLTGSVADVLDAHARAAR